jgi:DNA-binding CsgD family transcriptional regulator
MATNSEQLLRGIASCVDFDSVESRVMGPLARALGTRSAVLLQFEQRPGGDKVLTRNFYSGGAQQTLSLYSSGLYQEDPLVSACMRSFASAQMAHVTHHVLSLGRSLGPRRLHDSAFFRRFLQPTDIADVLGIAIPLRRGGQEIITLGFQRRTGEDCFEADEEHLLSSVGACLSHVLRDLVFEERLAVSDAAIEGLSSVSTAPELAVLGRNGRLHFATPGLLARHESSELALERELGRLFGPAMRDYATGLIGGGTLTRRIEAAGRQSAWRDVRLLKWGKDGPNPLFLLSFEKQRCAADGAGVRAGLTQQESVVCSLLCAGYGNGEIGTQLSISIRTVENHLRAIYKKLGVNTRSRAIAKLIG